MKALASAALFAGREDIGASEALQAEYGTSAQAVAGLGMCYMYSIAHTFLGSGPPLNHRLLPADKTVFTRNTVSMPPSCFFLTSQYNTT